MACSFGLFLLVFCVLSAGVSAGEMTSCTIVVSPRGLRG
jgi:hypothetical protein